MVKRKKEVLKKKTKLKRIDAIKDSSKKVNGNNGRKIEEIVKKLKEKVKGQRRFLEKSIGEIGATRKKLNKKIVKTGISGFDELLIDGVPQGSSVLIAGGAGSGKTIFCLQTLYNNALKGKKCLYISFEESKDRLVAHMKDFGWDAEKLIKKGNLKIVRISPFEITRNVDALLAKEKGELLIDVDPVILPRGFEPDIIALDSLTAIASAFTGKEESYRIYIEQLFRFFEKSKATSFLITETEEIPRMFSKSGVEEFLADGVVVLYSIAHRNIRENAVEIFKLRGARHQRKIVSMRITNEGIVVYPGQEVFMEV